MDEPDMERCKSSRMPRAAWIGLACAVLAAGLNPWGFAIYGIPRAHFDRETPFRLLMEWRTARPSLDPTVYTGRFGWLMILALLGVFRARRDEGVELHTNRGGDLRLR